MLRERAPKRKEKVRAELQVCQRVSETLACWGLAYLPGQENSNLCWGESQKGLGWEGPLKVHLDHGRDISHLIRLLRVQSNQTSNVLNDGALTTSLGMLC